MIMMMIRTILLTYHPYTLPCYAVDIATSDPKPKAKLKILNNNFIVSIISQLPLLCYNNNADIENVKLLKLLKA